MRVCFRWGHVIDEEISIEALYLTVDPYQRVFPVEVGQTPVGQQVARVVESRHSDYPVGKLLLAQVGCRDKTVLDPTEKNRYFIHPFTPPKTVYNLQELGDVSPSLYLGVFGMPGLTGYFGVLDKCQPKPGEVVLVSTAAGAVGSVVGQIAKIKGATVIGSAGSKEKCDWLKEVGFDHVFNYKETSVEDALKEFAPDGVDCYFDNVGGDYAITVLNNMRQNGRFCACGQISQYSLKEKKPVQDILNVIMLRELVVTGHMVYPNLDRFDSARQEMAQWIKEGKLKYKETIREDFLKLPDAMMEIFQGTAIGKLLVKA
ncbi:prostaglandin reductase 1 isoform X2 [Aplysia californica]|uniref:15-oxoprostaglandin 13-reductase n=1 Tax=Aplysia californica TaxID=6500 RepID=A0ABM1VSM3_APLCA|nr:prostaglandin reductase 1 isoform X2 [Aplysia californica]